MVSPLDNEIALFRQIAEGNESAFRQVYYHYYRQLHGFLLHIVKSEPVAEEIVQETFARLWENRVSLAEKGYSAPWLFRVGANLGYDHLKKAANEAKLYTILSQAPTDLMTNNVADHIATIQGNDLLERAISQLPAQRQAIFRLSRMEGLNHQEIADKLQISPNTVKNQLVTALKAVRQFMENAAHLLLKFILIFFLTR